jgi:hypothetical protein
MGTAKAAKLTVALNRTGLNEESEIGKSHAAQRIPELTTK